MEETGTTYYIYTDPLCDDLYGEIIIQKGEKREGLLFDFERYYRWGMDPDTVYVEELGGFFRNGDMAAGAEQLKEVLAFPITQEEYEGVKAEKEQEDNRILLVNHGEPLTGKEEVSIPVPVYELETIPIQEYEVWSLETPHRRERTNVLWGYTDAAQVADKLAGVFYQDMDKKYLQEREVYKLLTEEALEKAVYGELGLVEQFQEEGWEMDEAYDCYYIKTNEVAETLHLQYYFYPKNTIGNQTFKKALVVDVYLSEDGIEDMKINQIRIM